MGGGAAIAAQREGRRGERDGGQQGKKSISYQRSDIGDAYVGIMIDVVSMISTEARSRQSDFNGSFEGLFVTAFALIQSQISR